MGSILLGKSTKNTGSNTYSLSSMYAIQKTRFRCSSSTGFKPNPDPRLCRPILCERRIAAATRKNVGCGLGVPCRKSDWEVLATVAYSSVVGGGSGY